MSDEIDSDRRSFIGTAAMTLAGTQLGTVALAYAQSGGTKQTSVPAIKPGTHSSFSSLKQIDAGLLNVGYVDEGPLDGPAVEIGRAHV